MTWVQQAAAWAFDARGAGWVEHDGDNPGTFYFGGGEVLGTAKDQVVRFQTTGDVFTVMAPMPAVHGFFARSCKVGRSIYVLGGNLTFGGLSYTREFHRYDIDANAWVTLAQHPASGGIKAGWGLAYYNGFLYCFGGDTYVAGTSVTSVSIWRYEVATDTWAAIGTVMPYQFFDATTVAAAQAVTINDRIYIGPYPHADYTGAGYPNTHRAFLEFNPSTLALGYYAGRLSVGIASPSLSIHGGAIYLHSGNVNATVDANGWNRKILTTQPASDTAWRETGIVDIWTQVGGFAQASETFPGAFGGAGFLYHGPGMNSIGSKLWEQTVAVPLVAGADLSVLRDVGDFRYPYRWPQLIERWGGTDDEWDKVNEKFSYDEETGVFHGR